MDSRNPMGVSSYGTGPWPLADLLGMLKRYGLSYLELWPYTDEWGGANWGGSSQVDDGFVDRTQALLEEFRFTAQFANLHELGVEEFVVEMIDLFIELTPAKIVMRLFA